MRTFAAFQVLLLHYASAFLPKAAAVAGSTHYAWEATFRTSPAFFLADGYTAVGFFFLLSGFVLTPSFLSPRLSLGQNVLKRILRLGIPALGAALLCVGVLAVAPTAKHHAAMLAGSWWLDSLARGPRGLWSATWAMLRDLVVGNQGMSVFTQIGFISRRFPAAPVARSIDTPVWALHWELWGSLLLVGVAKAYRRLPRKPFWFLFGILVLFTGMSYLTLFLIGFLAYVGRKALLGRSGAGPAALGSGLITLGAVAVVGPDPARLANLFRVLPGLTPLSTFALLNEVGAVLVFVGILLCPPARRLLSCPALEWLGTLSFSIYLTHFIVLASLASLVFSVLAPHGYALAVAVALLAGTAATLPVALLFERFVDRPATQFARRACGRPAGPRSVVG
ncbi:MAG: acyltransferase [Actinomycetota bacterium]